jgi:GNAT superfamily N-acetyltransferase/uncharacterized protein YndB with AHSA1/START domain
LSHGHRDIKLGVPPEVVWHVLTAPGRHDWYYDLSRVGDLAEGARVTWIDPSGKAAEESEVLEVRPPHRLAVRTRFVFAPNFAAAAPHLITWELTPDGDGARVRLVWAADGPAAGLLESDGEALLQSLRLAVDPVARAELARLPEIGAVEIRDVTPDRVRDYQSFFDNYAFRDYPTWQDCYCMETHRTPSGEEWVKPTAAENRRHMTGFIETSQVTALLAFADGKPVGWCNYGESTRLAGLVHRFGLDAADHEGVGSVACFVIAAPYREHGVASKLLDAAVERLRARGLRAVEAYPVRGEDSAHRNYRGPLQMYLRAGFEPYRETDKHVIVRKSLA